eukprot:5525128-Alexandrium_andersonii.AAC.1
MLLSLLLVSTHHLASVLAAAPPAIPRNTPSCSGQHHHPVCKHKRGPMSGSAQGRRKGTTSPARRHDEGQGQGRG